MADVYSPDGVRPLNVTNADNRLIASAVRLAIEPVLAILVTLDQKGFIGGRSMLSNILDVEEALGLAAVARCGALAVFYDFAAAFPSIEHALLFAYFSALEWPPWLMRIIRIFYNNNWCDSSMGPAAFLGFCITRGIRQGCPLSPLLFAVASELIMRRLRRLAADNTSRAWADDIAMVIPRGLSVLPSISVTFQEFAKVSVLHLHIGKTVIVLFSQWICCDFENYSRQQCQLGARCRLLSVQNTWECTWVLTKVLGRGKHPLLSFCHGLNNGGH